MKQTVRGAAFQTLVDDEDEDGLLEEVANTATKRKRANTTGHSHRGGKRHDKICPACERPGHCKTYASTQRACWSREWGVSIMYVNDLCP